MFSPRIDRSARIGAWLAAAILLFGGSASAAAATRLLNALKAGSEAAFRIAPSEIGNAVAFQNYNGVINQFPRAANVIQSRLEGIYLRANGGALVADAGMPGGPIRANLGMQPDGGLRIDVRYEVAPINFSLQMAVYGNQAMGTYFSSSGLIIHQSDGSIGSSSSSTFSGNFRSALVPVNLNELRPLPPSDLEVSDESDATRRFVVRWQPGDDPDRIQGYYVYRAIGIGADPVRIGAIRNNVFVDDSDAVQNISLFDPIAYSIVAVAKNGKESLPAFVQIMNEPRAFFP